MSITSNINDTLMTSMTKAGTREKVMQHHKQKSVCYLSAKCTKGSSLAMFHHLMCNNHEQ